MSLDTSLLAPEHRKDAWRAYNSGLFDLAMPDINGKPFAARAKSYRIGQTVLGQYAVTSNNVRRTQQSLKVEREDLFVLRMHRRGHTKGLMSDAGFQMQSDRFTLFDFHQDLNAETEDVDYISFTMPYGAIGYDPSKHPHLVQFMMNSPTGLVLRSNLELILELLPRADIEQANRLADGFCGLLQGLVTREMREESVIQKSAYAKEVAVRRFIADNLRNPSLSADMICSAVGLSRPVLYRMLAPEGGVNRMITKLRLEHALDDLSHSAPERGAVLRVSRYWAFSDQAHFSRLFRNAFGFKPIDALGSALHALNPTPPAEAPGEIAPQSGVSHLVDFYN